MILLVVAAPLLAACASSMANAKKMNVTRCKDDPAPGPGLIPLTQSVEYLHSAHHGDYRGCITDIAAMQTITTTSTNNQPQAVPADPGCQYGDPTTTLLVAAYDGAGSKDTAAYGDDGGRQRGFIVGRLENQGRCATAAPISIPAGQVVYWVIDRLKGAKVVKSHFIMQGTDDYLDGHPNWTLMTCTHTNNGGADKAMFKVGDPCTDYAITPANFPPADSFQREGAGPGPRAPAFRLRLFEEAAWIVCGNDCCYANGFE